jgi:hypothetical protein
LDRASDFESAGRPFEPDRARHKPRGVGGTPCTTQGAWQGHESDEECG